VRNDETLIAEWKRSLFDRPEAHSLKTVELKTNVTRLKFEVHEKDLREDFIKGFGPGGQKTNKSNNCVVLKHLPTGLVVRVHDSRDQLVNRKLARKLLYERLDLLVNGETSTMARREQRILRSKERKRRRREQRLSEKQEGELSEDSQQEEDEEEDFSKYDDLKLDKIGKDYK